MLGWGKGKSDHPMQDEKGAKELLAELPANDPFKALDEVGHWLEFTRNCDGLKPQRIYEIVDQLDAGAKPHQRKLSQEYLSAGNRLQRFQEQRVWSTLTELWRQLGATYDYCLAQTLPGVSGSGALKPHAPVITCRAVRALALELKWDLLRYGPVDPTVWARLGALYAQAEQRGFALQTCTVYPGPQGESSVQREYLKGLMLYMSATDSLLPRKLELAERIIAQYCDQFVLQKQPATGCHYYADLATAKPPARMVARVNAGASVRYFGPGAAVDTVDRVIDTTTESGAVPSNLNLGGSYEPAIVVEVLRHLARYWSAVPPARAQERHKSFARISVVHNFDDVVAIISGESNDLAFDANIETWTVENESENGYGALIPQAKSDWLRVGTLLGIKPEEGSCWGVGIVRRMSNDGNQQRYVGIQTLAKGGARVKLFPVGGKAVSDSGEDAVLLPSSAADSSGSGELSLLMRMGTFSPRQSFQMRAYERNYVLVPKQLLEGGQDFDMAKFRVMQHAA